ncbi:type III secretion system export apparatus subunit SctV [Endozoicomonas sp. Mp262]|uniref:type III secretion system export apparatus subunit SctV n=1 Tax=Endozoicomonas sp. Mp262 TaxID=2919499 RepID=UPI0021D7D23D
MNFRAEPARLLNLIGQRSDVMLAVMLMMVVFLMILPLPTMLVDVLIGTNMGIAVIMMMLAIYIQSPLEFSAFPSVLLLTTLFRLSLSITTTRLILLQADAGQIVYTFGDFVVGGNLVVGLVIFLIITIVQFMVITKGSERVAEVSARFSLDAMPGKQMSIDGDMRAGVIDQQEAQRRRSRVQKESQLYGSMDGAMKFVKGDAMAGLIITAVNLLGGVGVGVMQHGMSGAEALDTYAILTIGDGLIAQIPALLISITAGIIVTRVGSDDEDNSNLGNTIGKQVTGHPKALLIGGSLLLIFAVIPGFPVATFLSLAVVVGGGGLFMIRKSKKQKEAPDNRSLITHTASADNGHTPARSGPVSDEPDAFALTVPLLLDVSSSLQPLLAEVRLDDELAKLRKALYMDLGIPFPGIHLRFNENLQPGCYQVQLQEVPVASGVLRPDSLLLNEFSNTLTVLGIDAEQGDQFLPGKETYWVASEHGADLDMAGIGYMKPVQILTYHLAHVLKTHADDFIGIQETRYLLEQMEGGYGELVKEVQRLLPLQKITEIMQRLVSEDISIRNLRAILEAMVEWGQKEKDVVQLTEYIRCNLKRYICYKYSNGQNVLPTYLLDPSLEDTIREGIRQTSGGCYLALDPSVTQAFVAEVKNTVGNIEQLQRKPVLMVSMDIRRYVRKLLEGELDGLPVLSFQEMTRQINAQPMGRVRLAS